MWDSIREFFGCEPRSQKVARLWDEAYQKGVAHVNSFRTALHTKGEPGVGVPGLRYDIPKNKVAELWSDVNALYDGGGFFEGVRDRLEELKHYNSGINDSICEIHERIRAEYAPYSTSVPTIINTERRPLLRAERNRKFYHLVARAPMLDSETFACEFRDVFRESKEDDSICNELLKRMLEDDAWIASQHIEFEQYNKFANPRPRTMEAFLAARGNTVNN